ncbi:MAG: PIN domain-containing protein [Actinobacteria bacterium]|nr:PIN domain-containing protein [Actinomycetota bacterium]
MYLFDTDAITNILKKKPSKKLLKNIKSVSKKEGNISTITLGEIIYGAYKSQNPDFHLNNLKTILLPMVNILPFDSRAAYYYGKIRTDLEVSGKTIAHADIQIASIASSNNLIIITGNMKHFSRINGLIVKDWIN